MNTKDLTSKFIKFTQDKMTKREIEWMMGDFIYIIYFLIVLVAVAVWSCFSAWWALCIVAVSFFLLLNLWAVAAYYIRKGLLAMLYPSTTKTDENGDDEEDYLDKLNKMLVNLKKGLE